MNCRELNYCFPLQIIPKTFFAIQFIVQYFVRWGRLLFEEKLYVLADVHKCREFAVEPTAVFDRNEFLHCVLERRGIQDPFIVMHGLTLRRKYPLNMPEELIFTLVEERGVHFLSGHVIRHHLQLDTHGTCLLDLHLFTGGKFVNGSHDVFILTAWTQFLVYLLQKSIVPEEIVFVKICFRDESCTVSNPVTVDKFFVMLYASHAACPYRAAGTFVLGNVYFTAPAFHIFISEILHWRC